MIIFYLATEEKTLLKAYFKTSPIALIRLKAQAIVMRDNRIAIKDIAHSLFKSERTITRWMKDFSVRRMASIFSGLKDNQNAAKLTVSQKNEIKETLSHPPSEQGLPKGFWDVPQLKKYVRAEFGCVYESVQSYHYLLQFSEFSFKYPDVFDIRRDEVQIHKRIQEIRKEIIPLMRNDEWVILTADETRVMREAVVRRCWLKKGERTVLKVDKTNESQYYFGALNLKTNKSHLVELDWGNEEEIIRAVEEIAKLYPGKRVCIIWDNVSFHKGKALRAKLTKGESLERVHLINFPPYAPDYNPQEQVWNAAKAHIANKQLNTLAAMKRSFNRFIATNIFNYTI